MDRFCSRCHALCADDALLRCPSCFSLFDAPAVGEMRLWPSQERFLMRKVAGWVFGSFSVFGVVSLIFMYQSFESVYDKGIQFVNERVQSSIAAQFQQERVQRVVFEAAKTIAAEQIRSEVRNLVREEAEAQRPAISAAVQAELERELRSRLRPRQVTDAQRANMADALKSAGKIQIEYHYQEDSEVIAFMRQVLAGLPVGAGGGPIPATVPPYFGFGLHEAGTKEGKSLRAALDAAKIPYEILQSRPAVCTSTTGPCLIFGYRK